MEKYFIQKIKEIGIIPIISIDDARNADSLGMSLLEAGLPCAEVTYRGSITSSCVKRREPVSLVATTPNQGEKHGSQSKS